MSNVWIARVILIGAVFLLPSLSFGHGCELLFARLDAWDGKVRLQVTADLAGNPMLHSYEQAAEALQTCLRVRTGDSARALSELSPVKLERGSVWDAEAPSVGGPLLIGESHDLLTAVWHWVPDAESVIFEVPKGNLHDVLLWRHEDGKGAGNPKWSLLIEGESSPLILVPRSGSYVAWAWGLCLAMSAICAFRWSWLGFHVPRRFPKSSM